MKALVLDFLGQLGFHAGRDTQGECLQFGTGKKTTTAILGLDFGTSCSKAVIQLPYLPGSPAFAVPLAKGSASPYLAKAADFIPPGVGAATKPTHQPRPNPKVDLLVNPDDQGAQELTAILLSRLMRAARKWFLTEHRKAYETYRLDWQANVGIPSSGYEDGRLKEVLTACARAGWELSKHHATPDKLTARNELGNTGYPSQAPVESMPEIAAAAVAYARSIHAHDGMHVMLDVGASTLDICGFMLQPKHPNVPFGLFATVVEHLGAAVLHDDRVRVVLEKGAVPGPSALGDPRDPAFEVPDSPGGYVVGGGEPLASLADHDGRFQQACACALRTVLVGMFKRNPNAHWNAGVPAFMTGGGGGMMTYRKILLDVPKTHHAYAWHNVKIQPLPHPRNLVPPGIPANTVDRLLVAYGLSVPGGGGMQIVNPATLPDVPPPPRRRLDHRYVSKDDV